MPWSNNSGGNSGGPWGGGGQGGGGGRGQGPWGGGQGGGSGGGGNQGGGEPPNIDELLKQGRDRMKTVFGDGGGSGAGPAPKGILALLLLLAVGFWLYQGFYTVRPNEQAMVLRFGNYDEEVGPKGEGLHFRIWPIDRVEIRGVTQENTIEIGFRERSGRREDQQYESLMLTDDEKIVDVKFAVVWNIRNLADYTLNLRNQEETIRAVAESAIREVVGRTTMKPILNLQRSAVEQQVYELTQSTLDTYEAGVNIIRVNFVDADPPPAVIDAFRDVQAAEQDRDKLTEQANAYSKQKLASARGEAEEILQQAEGYSARVVNEAVGQAERFNQVLGSYETARDVTRDRIYIETMEDVLGGMNKIIMEGGAGGNGAGGSGVVPYLPLDGLTNRGVNR